MAIGSSKKFLSKRKFSYLFIKYFGTLDLHSHLRLKPVLQYLKGIMDNLKTYQILEIGCGCGVIAFELFEKNKKIKYLGLDNNTGNIASANKILKNYDTTNINFSCLDVEVDPISTEEKFDIVLLIDILEHLRDPLGLLKRVIKHVNMEGLLIISVPTILYPKVFGQSFHRKVGHVIDGYNLSLLKKMCNVIDCDLISYKYNTGLFSNLGCAIFYRIPFINQKFEYLKSLLFYIFKYLDFINGNKVSCSLFAVFKVNGNEK